MLTDIDIHYLVGLLCSVSNPDDVEIILGDRVYNEATETKRDVDITITYKDEDGKINAFLGLEVKAHSAPLDSHHIEQLCAKLKTHKSISKAIIVSASGYTAPSKNVAKYNDIELFHLKNWDNTTNEFEHINIQKDDYQSIQESFEWIGIPHIAFNPDQEFPNEDLPYFSNECPVFDKNKRPIVGIEKLSNLSANILRNINFTNTDSPEIKAINPDENKSVILDTRVTDEPFMLVNGNFYQIKNVRITGTIRKKIICLKNDFKILTKDGDDSIRVGCIITELTSGTLVGLTASKYDRAIKFINIPVSDRLKNKIFRQKIK
jgi:hypothetical protein